MKKQSKILLDQIIEFEEIQDQRHKDESIKSGKGEGSVGQGWTIHHLKLLRQLLKGESQ